MKRLIVLLPLLLAACGHGEQGGSFDSNVPLLNQIWQASVDTAEHAISKPVNLDSRDCTIDLPLICPKHGKIIQAVDAPRLLGGIRGDPLVVFCGMCEQICSLPFKSSIRNSLNPPPPLELIDLSVLLVFSSGSA